MPVRSGGWTDDTFVNHNQRPHGEIMKEMGLRRALVAYLFLALFSHLSIAQEGGEHRPSRIIIHAAKLLEVKTGKSGPIRPSLSTETRMSALVRLGRCKAQQAP